MNYELKYDENELVADGVTYVAADAPNYKSCEGCAFQDNDGCPFFCSPTERRDGMAIVWTKKGGEK